MVETIAIPKLTAATVMPAAWGRELHENFAVKDGRSILEALDWRGPSGVSLAVAMMPKLNYQDR